MNREKIVRTHAHNFSPLANSGESLVLYTHFWDNGDDTCFKTQELTLNSYCNSVTLNLTNVGLVPSDLRKLADELEQSHKDANSEIEKSRYEVV